MSTNMDCRDIQKALANKIKSPMLAQKEVNHE